MPPFAKTMGQHWRPILWKYKGCLPHKIGFSDAQNVKLLPEQQIITIISIYDT